MNTRKLIHDAYAVDLMQTVDMTIYTGGSGGGITAKQDAPGQSSTNAVSRRMRAGKIIHAVESQAKHRASWLRTCYTPSQFCSNDDFVVVVDHIQRAVRLACKTEKDHTQCHLLIEARVVDARLSAFGGRGITLSDIQDHIGIGTGRWYSSMAWRDALIKSEMNRLDGITLGRVSSCLTNR